MSSIESGTGKLGGVSPESYQKFDDFIRNAGKFTFRQAYSKIMVPSSDLRRMIFAYLVTGEILPVGVMLSELGVYNGKMNKFKIEDSTYEFVKPVLTASSSQFPNGVKNAFEDEGH